MYDRWYASLLRKKLQRPFVHIMFGARQTGKSTLIHSLLPKNALTIDLSNPEERSRFLMRPGELIDICRALPKEENPHIIFIDEIQNVPELFNAVQHLYDNEKLRWRFILCGSSARKIRISGTNLLPGRSFLHHLYPLTLTEHPPYEHIHAPLSPLFFPWPENKRPLETFPAWDLESRLAYGELPGIVSAEEKDRTELLKAYSLVYLEEEIRRESLVRNWGAFLQFLHFAAVESGNILNYASISKETGISQPTVKTYYQLLEDMFIGFHIPAFSKSTRKNLLSTPRFLFFDVGVRHAAAGLSPSREIVKINPGALLEHWVGLELWKRLRYLDMGKLHYFRTRDGAEIDFIIEKKDEYIPIEVKWTQHPSKQDARHLTTFLLEHAKDASHGFIVCRCSAPMHITDKVTAIPWFCL